MDLQTLANLAQVVSALAVVAAVVFGLVQIRQFRLQRRDTAGVELVRSFLDAQFTQSYRLITSLPADASAEQLRAGDVAMEDAALIIGMRYEAIGLLVYRGILPLSLVSKLIGGVGIDLWSRIRAWAAGRREKQSREHFLEWFQWLVEQVERRGRSTEPPAYLEHRGWNPPAE